MEQKFKVVLSYLQGIDAAISVPETLKSKEDPAKQTLAVEALLKEVISTKLPEYRDKCFSVGGFVRDTLLGKNPKDIDIVVDDATDKMSSAQIFAKKLTDALGITTANNPHPLKEAYGIWGVVLFNPKAANGSREPFLYNGVDITGYVVELTPPRKEGPYNFQKREPQYVEYTSRVEDSKRRDLTINALYKNMVSGEIEDHVGGQKDLANKTLRPPEHPEGIKKIYEEDPLRILRIIRFSGKLPGFKVSPETERVVKDFLGSAEGQKAMKGKLSNERIRDEFLQILTHPNAKLAVNGMEMLRDYGLLKYLSTELDRLLDVFHDTVYHKGESIWQHTMEVLEKTPPTLKARLGALFHDIGKLDTMEKDVDSQGRDRVHFKGHEEISAQKVQKILTDLKFPTDIVKSIRNIVHTHMGFKDFESQKDKIKVRRMRIFIEKLKGDLDDAIALLKADSLNHPEHLAEMVKMEQEIKRLQEDDVKKGLLIDKGKGLEYVHPISGDDLMSEYAMLKGKELGSVLDKLKRMLLEGRFEGLDKAQREDKAKKLVKSIVSDKKLLETIE
jgi:tRNA nucleotidyltransferase (CCA-adding enzyme)